MLHGLRGDGEEFVGGVRKNAPLKSVLLKKVVDLARRVRIDQPALGEALNTIKAVKHLRTRLVNTKKHGQASLRFSSQGVNHLLRCV